MSKLEIFTEIKQNLRICFNDKTYIIDTQVLLCELHIIISNYVMIIIIIEQIFKCNKCIGSPLLLQ